MSQRMLAQKRVLERVPYSASHLARLEKAGLFPQRVKLGACRVGWVEDEINHWIEARMKTRNGEVA